jgi:hypothetical protein
VPRRGGGSHGGARAGPAGRRHVGRVSAALPQPLPGAPGRRLWRAAVGRAARRRCPGSRQEAGGELAGQRGSGSGCLSVFLPSRCSSGESRRTRAPQVCDTAVLGYPPSLLAAAVLARCRASAAVLPAWPTALEALSGYAISLPAAAAGCMPAGPPSSPTPLGAALQHVSCLLGGSLPSPVRPFDFALA